MSWSYTGRPGDTALDECRFLIGDTNPAEPILQDEEITYLIDKYSSNTNRLRYELFKHVSTIFARSIKRSLGPQAEDPSGRLKYFKEQMELYEKNMYSAGLSLPRYASPKVFEKGMTNNPPHRTLRRP